MWHWRCFPVFPKVDALWTSPDGLEGSSAFRRSGSKGSKGSKGGGIALSGDEYEVSVTGFTFSTIWYDKYSADWLAALASPYPASPDFPRKRGWQRNWIHRGAPRPANPVTCFPPGKVVAPATKGGHFLARQGGCMVFAAKGGIKNGAEGAVPRQRSDTI